MPQDVMEPILPEPLGPRPELELQMLRAMRRAFRQRTVAAVLAVFAAAMAVACLPDSAATLIEALRRAGVWAASGFCLLSLAAAVVFLRRSAALRDLGLPRARGSRAQWAWLLGGSMVGFALIATVSAWVGVTLNSMFFGFWPGGILAAWLGYRLKQIPNGDEAKQDDRHSLSLFQKDDERTGG